ncbi:MAG TPA: DUF3899 domain-containing protein [Bacilli bacterium]|nr:DUF3899 domain-containing protein [Bacilli bacterium]
MLPNQKRQLLKTITLFFVNAFLLSVVLLIKKDFTLRGFSDAAFISGAVLFLFGLLKLLATKGAYDYIGYTFIRFRDMFRKDATKSYPDAYSYVEHRKEERLKNKEKFYLELIIPGLFLIAALILALLA